MSSECFANIEESKTKILSLIQTGKIAEADAATTEMMALSKSQDKGIALQQIAGTYQNAGQADKAIQLCEYVLQNWPNEGFSIWVSMSMAISQIDKGYITTADATIERIIDDYPNNADLPNVLSIIADIYVWHKKYDKAERIYQFIESKAPGSSWAAKVRLSIARGEILNLIESKNYLLAEQRINSVITDFAGNADLAEMLYCIAKGYEWQVKLEEAKSVCQKIIERCPQSSRSEWARMSISEINICSLLVLKETESAQIAYDDFIINFSSHSEFPESLHNIARAWIWGGNYLTANNIYNRIIRDYPNSPVANKVQPYFQITDRVLRILSIIESEQTEKIQERIDQLIAEFNGHELLPNSVFICGWRYYTRALQKRNDGFETGAAEDFTTAISIWDKVIKKLPDSHPKTDAYYYSAICYYGLGDSQRAIEHYKKMVENNPSHEMAWDAQFKIGYYYQELKDNSRVDKSVANAETKAAYEKVLERYPDCPAARAAENWLKNNSR